jgi:L-methionine (R)-S-oxide reductase
MTASKPELYRDLAEQLRALLAGEADRIANAANMAALIYHGLPDLNWAGFYFRQGPELVLGPFQGKPACVRIPLGKGVCGTAAARAATVLVPDVHDFPGLSLATRIHAPSSSCRCFPPSREWPGRS